MNGLNISLGRGKISKGGLKWSSFFVLSAVLITSGFFVFNVVFAQEKTLNLVMPNGGEMWRGTQTIQWNQTGFSEEEMISILLSNNSGSSYTTLIDSVNAINGEFLWNTNGELFGKPDGNTYRIRLSFSGLNPSSANDFIIDNTPPTTTISIDLVNGENGWYTSVPSIILNCTDTGGSGCKAIFYKWDGTPSYIGVPGATATVTGLTEGEHTLYYYSTDNAVDNVNANNQEPLKNLNIKLDTAAPTVEITGAPEGLIVDKEGVTATVDCSDIGDSDCDLSSYKYKVYTTDPTTCSMDPAEYSGGGSVLVTGHSWVCGYAKDVAGNEAFSDSVEFNIFGTIQSAIDAADSGDTINITTGNYPEKLDLKNKSLTLNGAGSALTTINASSFTDYAIQNFGTNSSVKNLKLIGSSNYGFKVSSVSGITLENIVVENSGKTGIDLNTVSNATLNNISVNNTAAGFGLIILNSQGVTVTNITTNNNTWGGVSVQTSKSPGSNNITFSGTFNVQDNFPLLLENDPDSSNNYHDITNIILPDKFGYITYGFREKQNPSTIQNYKQWYYFETLDTAKAVAQGLVNSTTYTYSDVVIYDILGENYYVEEGMKIQDAIIAATDNDTINVGEGIYTEQITINKILTLTGTGDTTIIQSPNALISTFSDSAGHTIKPIVTVAAASTAISQFKIDGLGKGNANNRFVGIGLYNTSGNINHVTVTGIRDNPLSGVQHGVGIFGYNADSVARLLTVSSNTVIDYQKNAMVFNGSGLTVDVDGNTTTGAGEQTQIAQNGIQLGDGATGTIQNNIVSGNLCNHTSCGNDWYSQYQSAGIMLYNAAGPLTISKNQISTSDMGIYDQHTTGIVTILDNALSNNRYFGILLASGDVSMNGGSVSGSDIGIFNPSDRAASSLEPIISSVSITDNSSFGVKNDASYSVNAKKNWWGTAYRPMIETLITDNVDFDPYWVNEEMDILSSDSVEEVYVDNDFVDGMESHIYGYSAFSKIQEGIDAVALEDNGTVNVAAGTYTENVTIDKSLTLRGDPGAQAENINDVGPGLNSPVLDGTGLNGSAIIIDSGVTNVLIEGFGVCNYTDISNGGMGAITSWNTGASNITIQDNYLHNIGWNGVLVGSDDESDDSTQSGWTVKRNIVEGANYAGIELTNTTDSEVAYNKITIGAGIGSDPDDSGVGIEIAVRDHGTGAGVTAGTGVSVHHNEITGDELDIERAGINILSRAYQSASVALLTGVTVENNTVTGAARGIYVVAEARNNGTASIDNLTVNINTLDGNGDGIVVRDFVNVNGTAIHDNISVTGNTIINSTNPSSGIHILSGTSAEGVIVTDNTISGNAGFGVNNEGSGILDAERNRWGDITGPNHNTLNPIGIGNAVSNNVDFSPFCLDEDCTLFGSVDAITSFILDFNPNPQAINSNSDLTVTAMALNPGTPDSYVKVNDSTSQIQLIADSGASFSANLLTLTTNGTAQTIITNDKVGTVNVSATLTSNTSIVSTGQVEFEQSDTIAPVMQSHIPAADTVGVAVTVVPTITFSKALNTATVNSTNIQLWQDGGIVAVPAIVSPAEGNTMVLITPLDALQNNTQYYLTVSDAVTDTVGNPLNNPFGATEKESHSFTTIAIQPIVTDKLEQVNNSPIANDSYLDGWHHVFEITINTNETNLFVNAEDWVNSADPNLKVLASGNMRLLFNLSTGNGLGSIVGLTDEDIESGLSPIISIPVNNEYGAVGINIDGLDISTNPGLQIKFDVFTKIPVGTAAGFYDTNFGIDVK